MTAVSMLALSDRVTSMVTLSAIAGLILQPAALPPMHASLRAGLGLTYVASPEWGRVVRPPSGTARYTLSYSTGAVTLVSGDGYAFNDGMAGEFTATGSASEPVTFSMSIGAFSGSGVTVVSAHINGLSASGSDTLNGSGTLTLRLGGTLDIASNASLGQQTAVVTVTLDNQ